MPLDVRFRRSTSEATRLGWACWLVELRATQDPYIAVPRASKVPCEPRPTQVPRLKRASSGTSPLGGLDVLQNSAKAPGGGYKLSARAPGGAARRQPLL